jgi:hypothetical protein
MEVAMNIRTIGSLVLKLGLLTLLFFAAFMVSTTILVRPLLNAAEPSTTDMAAILFGYFVMALVDTLLAALIIMRSRWGGWRLMLALAVSLYGAMTIMAQIETAWFAPVMTTMHLTPTIIGALVIQTLPVILIFTPLAVLLLGKGRQPLDVEPGLVLAHSFSGWAWRLALIAGAYLVLYFGFGYVVAWQNPAVRALYDEGRNPAVFDPGRLVPFQVLRALLWAAFAMPVLLVARGQRWYAAVLIGLLFALPMNIVHILPSPLMEASVRLSHFIETSTSNFIFGLIVAGLLLWQPKAAARPVTPMMGTR